MPDIAAIHDPHPLPRCGQQEIVDWLGRPSAYGETTTNVECIETHISWVFLTDRFVYKLKKQLQFDFLNYSSVDQRRWACEQEVSLNRRMAASVYIAVLPVTIDAGGHFWLDGDGETVDWLVMMRRLAADAALDQKIAQGHDLPDSDIDQIADCLIDFYQGQPPLGLKTDDYRRAVDNHIAGNQQVLSEAAGLLPGRSVDRVCRIHAAQRRLLQLAPDLLDNRVRDGRIVDGHGDLRPDHIYLTFPPTVIDCVEFNAELRMIDVVDELGFLAMECDHLGAHPVGQRILQRYCDATGDRPPRALVQFYQSYRACVRAKVHWLRSCQLAGSQRDAAVRECLRYLDLAESDISEFDRPFVIAVRGLAGSGKSTLATALSQRLHCELLQTDAIRQEMYSAGPRSAGWLDNTCEPDRYDSQHRMAVYEEMFRQAGIHLQQRRPVILDGTFLSANLRLAAERLAQQYDTQAAFVHCHCAPELAMTRISQRAQSDNALSEATPAVFELQRQLQEADPARLHSLMVDTGHENYDSLAELTAQLRAIVVRE